MTSNNNSKSKNNSRKLNSNSNKNSNNKHRDATSGPGPARAPDASGRFPGAPSVVSCSMRFRSLGLLKGFFGGLGLC